MMEAIAVRFRPGQDLKVELDDFIAKRRIEAACILTCVGSLSEANLRFANQPEGTVLSGKFEIVSLTGVMSVHGSHYHLAIADSTGRTIGGHLLKGCLIYTTAEIVIGILPQYCFRREPDLTTGFRELAIESIEPANRANPLS